MPARIGIYLFALLWFSPKVMAQVEVFHGRDSVSLTLGAYADIYYGYDFNQPADKERPYVASASRHNEMALNLAIVEMKFQSPRVRLTISPAFGTMMQRNYAHEPAHFENVFEGYAGIKPFKKVELWVDAGVFVAPYTNEGSISMDQLCYTRSYACENTPYYVSGVRASFPIGDKINAKLFVINGWQVIQTDNPFHSFGSTLEYKPGKRLQINWSNFAGKVPVDSPATYPLRLYSDITTNWNMLGKTSASICGGYGVQEGINTSGSHTMYVFWHLAGQIRQRLSRQHAIACRVEYFNDVHGILTQNINQNTFTAGHYGLTASSVTLNYTWSIAPQVQFRLEGRHTMGEYNVFLNQNQHATRNADLLISSLAVHF